MSAQRPLPAVVAFARVAHHASFTRAADELGVSTLLIAGGVAANSRLRELAEERCAAAGLTLRVPRPRLCTDNGAMIAGLAAQLIMSGRRPSTLAFGADSTLPVTEIQVAESEPGEVEARREAASTR